MKFKFKLNDIVMVNEYATDTLVDEIGVIKGVHGRSIIGHYYIVEFPDVISKTYPYTNVIIQETWLDLFSQIISNKGEVK